MRAYAVAGLITICVFARPAFGEPQEENRVLAKVTLDIDNDGKLDRAVLVERGDSLDLSIYLGVGDEKLEPSRKPTFLKKNILRRNMSQQLESKGARSLIVHTGSSASALTHSEGTGI